jgi:hypothetical protein
LPEASDREAQELFQGWRSHTEEATDLGSPICRARPGPGYRESGLLSAPGPTIKLGLREVQGIPKALQEVGNLLILEVVLTS